MFLPPFEGPFAKLEHAGRRLVELHEIVEDYQKSVTPSFVKTERTVAPWDLASDPPIPATIPLTMGDIAHSLRSALDVMVCDIAAIRNVGLSDMTFPFFDSEETFRERLQGPTKRAPFLKLGADVVKLIEHYQPYRGGNELLRGLHDLNNVDKHRMVLPTTQYAPANVSLHAMLSAGLDEQATKHPPGSIERERLAAMKAKFVVLSPTQPTVALETGEPIPAYFYTNHPSEGLTFGDWRPSVVFPKSYFLSGPVVGTMARLTNAVFSLVEDFKAVALP